MSEPIALTQKTETTPTGARRVVCSGPEVSRHPKVYLSMGQDGQGHPTHVVCPYCSHVFVYDARQAAPGGH